MLKRVVSAAGYRLIDKIADINIPPNTGDFRLMSRRVVKEINRLKESHGFLRGLVAVVGFRQTSVLFDRPPRFEGEGNYNRFLGSLRIGFNGIFCFSNYALTLSTIFGFITAGFSFLLMATYLFYKLMGWQILWGNPTLVILISFLGGIQLISVGILGEYIGRIYEEVRERPKFIVDRKEGFESVTLDRKRNDKVRDCTERLEVRWQATLLSHKIDSCATSSKLGLSTDSSVSFDCCMLISIVVPVYREEKNIPEFLSRVVKILERITSEFEIIFSMDPSADRTEEIILEHRSKDQRD